METLQCPRYISYLLLLATTLLQKTRGQDIGISTSTSALYRCNLAETITNTSTNVCQKASPWQLDNTCQAGRQEGSCTDCLDCDPCRSHSGDCEACSNSDGCVWCPGDALCSSYAITQDIWSRLGDESELGDELQPSCLETEDWLTTCTANTNNSFSDPLMDSMNWLYDMIHVTGVWEAGITGKGVRIRVNDVGGVDVAHAEFDDRFDQAASCDNYEPPELGQAVVSSTRQHGTGVASLAVGGANNNQCAVGIAPEATLSVCTLPEVGNPSSYATIMKTKLDDMDISVNAWTVESCVLQDQRRREWRRTRQLQTEETVPTCPFSNELSSSPCDPCGTELAISTSGGAADGLSSISPTCRHAIAGYCLSRFEEEVEACSDYLSLYAECDYDTILTNEEISALEQGIKEGRNGKGINFVMSAGNGYVFGDSTNANKYITSRYTLSVGAVDKLGLHSSYSATGASLFVSAPGGDLKHLSNNWVAKVGGGCHDITAGTSFSAPVVAGVIGLMLEANPNLSWRDVQNILASTSQHVDPEDDAWTVNAAGFRHSYLYGFGVIHAEAAVATAGAQSWTALGPEGFILQESEAINLPIPPASETLDTATTNLTIATDMEDFKVESVVVMLQIEHPSRGDLSIVLTSPQGTESILHFSPRPENTHLNQGSFWEVMTVRNWGEAPVGEWTLAIRDDRPGNLRDGCVDMPWNFILDASPDVPAGARVTCGSIQRTGSCANGQLVNQNMVLLVNAETQVTPDAACCICGGGGKPSEIAQLVAWTLTVYGSGAISSDESESNGEQEGGEGGIEVTNGDDTTSDGKSDGGGKETTNDNDNATSDGTRKTLGLLAVAYLVCFLH